MQKFIASLCSVPVVFFIGQYFSASIKCLTNALKNADPDFPHTFGQLVGKGLLDTVNFIMFAALACSVFCAFSCYMKYRDEQQKAEESRK